MFALAQIGFSDPLLNWLAIIAVFVALVFVPFVVLLSTRYKRCPSNRVLVIYGRAGGGAAAKCVHGGAAFVIPLIQDYAFLNLEPLQIEIPLRGALSAENIRVNVPSVFTVAIGTTPEVMQNASVRVLGLSTEDIRRYAEEIIFGQLRQVIASMGIEDINRDRDTFLQHVQNSLEPELKKVGLVLINVNITDITDESGYIEAIGRKAASEAIQQAAIDVAEQQKHGAIGVALAEREKAVQVASAERDQSIGTREAQRDTAVRVAELEKETKIGEQSAAFQRDAQVKESERIMRIAVAEADARAQIGEQTATFQREAQVKDAERTMRIAVAEADAKAIEGENVSKARIADSQADLQVRRAEAFQLGETRKREAEAAVLEAQNRAMAKAALAEAEKVEAERRAAVEAPAKAEKAKIIVEAEAAAEKSRIEAQGQAAAAYAELEAQARGQYEILAKKADGLRQIVEACGGSQQAFQLLMLEHLDKLAETAAHAISNIRFDKVVVWENGTNQGTSNTANFLHNMARTLPPMLQVMKDIGGVEIPESLVKFTSDGQPVAATTEAPGASAKATSGKS